MSKKIWFLFLALGLTAVLSGCAYGNNNANSNANQSVAAPTPPTPQPAPTPVVAPSVSAVTISNLAFNPAQLDIKIGATVTWTNNDPMAHTITSDNGQFASPTISSGSNFSFTFTKAGTYQYHCAIHPSMTGVVIVK